VESDLDEPSGRKCIVYFGYAQENFEEFRERVYESVRQIHITRFLQILVSDYKDAVEKRKKTKKKTNNVLLHKSGH
jgi:hypothetical protein